VCAHISMKQANPVASVIVVAYNQERFISQAIESVLAQRETRIECIFVNDGSTDRSLEIVRNIAETDPRLRAYSINNSGPSNARNHGYSHINASSQYVCFLDGDDLLCPDFIGSCINYLERNPDVGVVLPDFDRVDVAGHPIPAPSRNRWAPGPLWLPRLLPDSQPETPFVTFYCGSGVTPFWLARRSVFDKTDGWDIGLWPYEDTDMLCQLSMLAKVHSVRSRLVGYRQHQDQSTTGGAQRSRHWKEHGLARMQAKWDREIALDHAKAEILDRACVYYHQVHEPLRNLFVARRAFWEFIRNPSAGKLGWFLQLLLSFFVDFLYYKLFFWRSTRRWRASFLPD
jgi:glycosyltransferase involved in cell wall biosynthesis